MKTLFILLICSFCVLTLAAQDTLRYMHYNLLDYSIPFVNCSDTNNAIAKKNAWMRTILNDVKPDILAVCEMGANNTSIKMLLDSVLNAYSTRVYKAAQMTNTAGSSTVNMIYYNPLVVKLKSQDVVSDVPRDINMYKFYLNTMDLPTLHDTTFFTAILAHLKAGATAGDSVQRAASANKLITYLNAAYPLGNYILSGDLNLYSSTEQAWQTLTGQMVSSHNFFDPLNTNGNWHGNINFSAIHTQSTHSDNDGCHASGGMDDRFDFVLVSGDILAGALGIKALANTYTTLGEDGNHFNSSIIAMPQNTSVSHLVLDALYGNSDHLPVILDLQTEKHLGINNPDNLIELRIRENPAYDQLHCSVKGLKGEYVFEILTIDGQTVTRLNKTLQQGMNSIDIPLQQLKPGLYFLRISDQHNNSTTRKFVVEKP